MVRQGATAGVGHDDRRWLARTASASVRSPAWLRSINALGVHRLDHGLPQRREAGVFVGQAAAATAFTPL
jgi:hypothetical protein